MPTISTFLKHSTQYLMGAWLTNYEDVVVKGNLFARLKTFFPTDIRK